nr:MAG TPA: hypothetical protein [Caudoviricetes sp.]
MYFEFILINRCATFVQLFFRVYLSAFGENP